MSSNTMIKLSFGKEITIDEMTKLADGLIQRDDKGKATYDEVGIASSFANFVDCQYFNAGSMSKGGGEFYRWTGINWALYPEDHIKSDVAQIYGTGWKITDNVIREMRLLPGIRPISVMNQNLRGIYFNDQVLYIDKEGKWQIENHKKENYNTHYVDYSLADVLKAQRENTATPAWDAMLENMSLTPEDIKCIHEAYGYSLYHGLQWSVAFICTGGAGTGKNTLLMPLQHILRGQVGAKPVTKLAGTFAMGDLVGKRINVSDEAKHKGSGDSDEEIENVMKTVITGGLVESEKKFQAAHEAHLDCVFWFLVNGMPRRKDTSGAINDRMVVIPIENPLKRQDKSIREVAEEIIPELPAIIAKALKALKGAAIREDARSGKFTQSERAQELKQDNNEDSDTFLKWFNESVTIEDGKVVNKEVAYGKYRAWYQENFGNLQYCLSLVNFTRRMKDMLVTRGIWQSSKMKVGGVRVSGYCNIKVEGNCMPYGFSGGAKNA